MRKNLAVGFVLSMVLLSPGCSGKSDSEFTYSGSGYPRLAMWWPSSWKQPVEDLARYDWIGWGSWENMSVLAQVKEVNPRQKHFLSFSITETGWRRWEQQPELMDRIPSEWFLTQLGTTLAQDIDANQTVIPVAAVTDSKGNPLFEVNDTITCEFESMRVLAVDKAAKTLKVSRGFVRKASSHSAGTRIAPQITFWPKTWVMNMSTLCPEVDIGDGHGPQKWVDYASRNFLPDDDWDGYVVDRIESSQSWLTHNCCRTIDPDCSNREVTDGYSAFDAAWYGGCESFLAHLRDVYPGKPIVSNTSGAYYHLLNGAIYESFPGNWRNTPETYQDWARRALGERGYIQVSKSGYMPNYSFVETYEDEEGPDPQGDGRYDNPFEKPGFVPNYRRMRYGLTTALLGDGYFSYEINTNGHGSLGLMWFDEYDNAGKGRGYLGYPRGDAKVIMEAGDGSVWRRDYDHGVAICNPTNQVVTVDLGGSYRLIKGRQVPDVNTGEVVSQVTLQPRDGRILLK